MEIPTRRRRALSTVLALFLAIESVSAVAAVAAATPRAGDGSQHPAPAAATTRVALAARAVDEQRPAAPAAAQVAAKVSAGRLPEAPDSPKVGPTRTTEAAAVARPARLPAAAVSAIKAPAKASTSSASSSNSTAKTSSKASSGTRTYKGRNHVWIPALGINRSVSWFSCDREREPDNYVYRWGCAGRNNVYLLGHAHSVFKPLHDAYVSGRLRKGMKAIYADGKGKIHTYTVRWWKLTRPTTSASWAWAAQSVPSMTLQTCVGRNNEYRLMVRLVEVN